MTVPRTELAQPTPLFRIGPLKTQPTEVHLDQEPPPAETMLAVGIGGAAGAGAGAGAGTGLGLAVGVEPPPQPTMTTVTTTINNRRIINSLRRTRPFEDIIGFFISRTVGRGALCG